MKKLLLILFISSATFAQKDGFWDKERAFTKEIKLSSGNRTIVQVDDLPEGASEFVYRISLIDENSKITNSLASVLKVIPDPTGISQGASGAITLTNAFTGDDTCLYGIFTSEKATASFLKDGKFEKACYAIKEPVNKDSKLISIKNTTCFENAPHIWFAFENKNWVMSTKIVLEVVSWVDYKASRGWNVEAKKELTDLIYTTSFAQKVKNKQAYFAHFLDIFSSKFKYSEYKNLLPYERATAVNTTEQEALKKVGEFDLFLNAVRENAESNFKKGNTEVAIDKIQKELVVKNLAKDVDYALLSKYYLLSKQYVKAEEQISKAIKLNPSEIKYQLQLAHVFQFTERFSEAKDIHKKYKTQNVNSKTSWFQQTKNDFKEFEQKGLPTDDFKKILRILE